MILSEERNRESLPVFPATLLSFSPIRHCCHHYHLLSLNPYCPVLPVVVKQCKTFASLSCLQRRLSYLKCTDYLKSFYFLSRLSINTLLRRNEGKKTQPGQLLILMALTSFGIQVSNPGTIYESRNGREVNFSFINFPLANSSGSTSSLVHLLVLFCFSSGKTTIFPSPNH